MGKSWLFTSESVSEGHPDKVCDRISDAILDAYMREAPDDSRCAVETLATTNHVTIAGEVRGPAALLKEVEGIAREAIRDIGYEQLGFSWKDCEIITRLHAQSSDIAMGVDEGDKGEAGAGDQGMMFGFACRETEELMPLPIQLSHRLVERHAHVRRDETVPGLRPDAKAQVTVEYENGKPRGIDTVVLSTQHDPHWNEKQADLRKEIIEEVIKPVLGERWNPGITVHVNPTGRFEIGGPHGDAGLTGRKIIVDTYGGRGRHGGGAFSGKDPTKVDRSAAYMARYIAKNIVAAELARECEVQLSYAIGVAEPTSVHLDCFGTESEDKAKIEKAVREVFQLTPRGIIETLKLRKPIYRTTARHGHFGRKPFSEGGNDFFTWEKTDKIEALRSAIS